MVKLGAAKTSTLTTVNSSTRIFARNLTLQNSVFKMNLYTMWCHDPSPCLDNSNHVANCGKSDFNLRLMITH